MPDSPQFPTTDTDELPIQVSLRPRKSRDPVTSFRSLRTGGRRAHSGGRKKSVPIRGASAPATRQREGVAYRRVVVKARVIKMNAYGMGAARLHLRYLDREGTGRTGEREGFFDREQTGLQRSELAAIQEQEPHQFRLIVSPEDADQINLTDYTRDLMKQVESDLGRKLRWSAINHYNTDNPHTHLVIHGLDQKGEPVFIDREYISHGLRHRASELMTRELGQRMEHEIIDSIRKEIHARRLTAIDRELVRQSSEGHLIVEPIGDHPAARLQRSRMLGRLSELEKLGFAERQAAQQWKLDPQLTRKLTQLQRFDEGMQRLRQVEQKLPHPASAYRLHTRGNVPELEGVVLERGLSDEMSERGYLILGDRDGVLHQIEIPNLEKEKLQPGQVVRVQTWTASSSAGTAENRQRTVFQLQHHEPLKAQVAYRGRSWLDDHYHELVGDERPYGVTARLRQAAQARARWLQAQGLEAGTQASRMVLDGMERKTLAAKISSETGLTFRALGRGDALQGELLGVVETPSTRRYAVVGNSQEFSMVPWKKEEGLENGKSLVIGINQQGRAWTKSIQRGLSR